MHVYVVLHAAAAKQPCLIKINSNCVVIEVTNTTLVALWGACSFIHCCFLLWCCTSSFSLFHVFVVCSFVGVFLACFTCAPLWWGCTHTVGLTCVRAVCCGCYSPVSVIYLFGCF